MSEFKLDIQNTVSPEKYKNSIGATELNIKENPKSPGKFFMVNEAGVQVGGVSPELVKAVQANEDVTPVVSWVTPLDDAGNPSAESFFLLHRRGEGAKTIFKL